VSFVLDNSVALAWCFEDEHTPANLSVLDRLTEADAIVPQLWPIEAVNGLLTAERRRRVTGAERHRLTSFLHALPISVEDQTTNQAWTVTAHLAEQHRLTAYDATYLELALRFGLPLATNDKALIVAAKEVGVTLLAAVISL
jgi:predicted nucleic acid-binding protein